MNYDLISELWHAWKMSTCTIKLRRNCCWYNDVFPVLIPVGGMRGKGIQWLTIRQGAPHGWTTSPRFLFSSSKIFDFVAKHFGALLCFGTIKCQTYIKISLKVTLNLWDKVSPEMSHGPLHRFSGRVRGVTPLGVLMHAQKIQCISSRQNKLDYFSPKFCTTAFRLIFYLLGRHLNKHTWNRRAKVRPRPTPGPTEGLRCRHIDFHFIASAL